jgi:Ca2+-binding EF-hand superfamily protein
MAYANMSEMRRIASMVVAHKSSTQEILEMRDAFDKYDVQRDGVISMEEFKAALSEFNYTDDELNDLFIRMVRNTTSNFPVSLIPIYTHCSHLE